jgi:hypothetical protein
VFFGGLYFKHHKLDGVLSSHPLRTLRAEFGEDAALYDRQGEQYLIVGQEIGKGEVLRTPPPERADDDDVDEF